MAFKNEGNYRLYNKTYNIPTYKSFLQYTREIEIGKFNTLVVCFPNVCSAVLIPTDFKMFSQNW